MEIMRAPRRGEAQESRCHLDGVVGVDGNAKDAQHCGACFGEALQTKPFCRGCASWPAGGEADADPKALASKVVGHCVGNPLASEYAVEHNGLFHARLCTSRSISSCSSSWRPGCRRDGGVGEGAADRLA
ncbi:hypothetical protein N9L68_01770 [bacterium]|nr:hypothetical protein [bacterium]